MSSPAWQTPTPLSRLAADTIVWELINCCSPEYWPYEIETNYQSQNDDYFVNRGPYEQEDFMSEDEEEEPEPDNDIINAFVPLNDENGENAVQGNDINNQNLLMDAIPQEGNEDIPANANPIDEHPVAENDIAEIAQNEHMQHENGLAEMENIPNPNQAVHNNDDVDRDIEANACDAQQGNNNENPDHGERMDDKDEDEQSVGSSSDSDKLDLDLVLLASGHGRVNYRGKKYTNREDVNRHLKAKIWVLKRLKKIKNWWDSTDILGPLHSRLQLQLREAFYENLQFCDDLPHLYKFLLQILFSSETGLCLPSDIFTNDERQLKRVSLGLTSCKVFANVVKALGPFTLERLVINTMKFMNISPLMAIFSNAPYLKTIDIKDCPEVEDIFKCSPSILKCISECCPLLEVLEIDYAGIVPILGTEEDYIYKSFFSGMNKEKVLENIGCLENVCLPFPCLKKIKLLRVPKDFLGNLTYFYSDLQSVDYTFGHENFPKNLCYLKNVQLTSELMSCLTNKGVNKVKTIFPKIKHITIYHDCENSYRSTLNSLEMCRNLSVLVNEGKVSSLCLKINDFYRDEHSYPDLSPYFPSFEKVGQFLKNFTLIISLCDVKYLARLINECSNVLSVKVILSQRSIPFSAQTEDFQLKPKSSLKSLTMLNDQDTYTDASCKSQFDVVVKSFLKVSPNIETLEIDVREIKTVLSLITELKDKRCDGFYNHITEIILVRDIMWFERYQNIDLGYNGTGEETRLSSWMVDNINKLIESLPQLKTLVMYFQLWDFLYFSNHYPRTALKFVHGKTDLPKGNNACDYNC